MYGIFFNAVHLAVLLSFVLLAQAWTFRLVFPHVPQLNGYNPSTLPCSTHATLFKMGNSPAADITRRNTIEFSDLEPGSYLLTVTTRDWTYPPSRVDVNSSALNAKGTKEARIDVWQTFWGNEWGNKGEYRGGGAISMDQAGKKTEEENVIAVEIKPIGKKEYYLERAGFSPLQFLRSPMILMAVFSLVLIVGLPYLMDNMDEETRAEFEEMQKQGITGRGGSSNPADSIQNFDLAGWMAGKSTSSNPSEGDTDIRKRKQ